jgi:hypothetical protein
MTTKVGIHVIADVNKDGDRRQLAFPGKNVLGDDNTGRPHPASLSTDCSCNRQIGVFS